MKWVTDGSTAPEDAGKPFPLRSGTAAHAKEKQPPGLPG